MASTTYCQCEIINYSITVCTNNYFRQLAVCIHVFDYYKIYDSKNDNNDNNNLTITDSNNTNINNDNNSNNNDNINNVNFKTDNN